MQTKPAEKWNNIILTSGADQESGLWGVNMTLVAEISYFTGNIIIYYFHTLSPNSKDLIEHLKSLSCH